MSLQNLPSIHFLRSPLSYSVSANQIHQCKIIRDHKFGINFILDPSMSDDSTSMDCDMNGRIVSQITMRLKMIKQAPTMLKDK